MPTKQLYDPKNFKERIKKLLKFLNKHCDEFGTSDYVSAGDVAGAPGVSYHFQLDRV